MRHIHLDPLGGVAGDMFAAALLDAFPAHAQDAARAAALLSGVPCRLAAHDDGTLTGRRFLVDAAQDDAPHHHHHHHHDEAGHMHPREADATGSWRALRARIEAAALPDEVRRHALGIFGCLAEAEGRVHGVAADAVTFHEVGAADSVADIVAAAWVIAMVGPATWSVGALPLGAGTVRTAHGPMPVPAPATALLLEGFTVRDDGVGGERVTPTGAAILRHLGCAGAARPRTATLRGSGIGFGSRVLPGMSNCLRALVLDTTEAGTAEDVASGHRALAVIAFEVDDQSGEDLAAGLDQLRGIEGVHDVVQMAAFGKKNRMAVHVQVLVRPDRLDAAVEACFRETTTIGLRTHLVQGRALPRRFAEIPVDGHAVAVKLVERPGGVTAKAESDSLRQIAGHAARTGLRRAAERKAEAE
ncbi:MAG: LarC family nickel insertion protein [Janthinobacterium lividum]